MSSKRPAIELQRRDRAILDVLTHRVRALTIAQVARRCWPRAGDPERATRSGRHPSNSEAYHDFHLSAVYFQMLDELPTRAGSWTLETDLPKGQGIKIPDAMVRDGIYQTGIEFGDERPIAA